MQKSEVEPPKDFLSYFTINILIRPLTHIQNLLNAGDYFGAFIATRNYVVSLPPKIAEKFEEEKNEMDRILREMREVEGFNWNQVLSKKMALFDSEGREVVLRVYDKMWPIIYSEELFTMLKGISILTPASTLKKKKASPDVEAFPERLPESLRA